MTDSMKFGPEWLRNMNSDTPSLAMGANGGGVGSTSSSTAANTVSMVTDSAPIIMAQFRYGREEMLLLFNRCNLPPDPLKSMQGLYVEKQQMPINLITLTEEETRMWNKGINSDAALRLAKPGSGPGAGMPGARGALGGRGGSMDRGRGRARGSYHYSRGLSYEDTDTSSGFSQRGIRNYDRTQSQGNWNERNGGDVGEYTATSPRKEYGARSLSDTNWRRQRGGGEEDDTWRNNRSEKWGRGNSNSWRESDSNWDRSSNNNNNHNNNHLPGRKPWESEETNLPEWATENPSERGGSFDASGAFHGGSAYSDDDEGEGHPRSEKGRNNTNSTSQPRPASQTKKEPPNIPNGNASNTSSGTGSLKQSQSATSLSTEQRPIIHPITTSASFSGMETNASPMPRRSKPPARREDTPQNKSSAPPPAQQLLPETHLKHSPPPMPVPPVTKTSQEEEIEQRLMDAADVFVSQLMDEEEKDPPASSTTATPPLSHAQSHPHTHANTVWFYQDPQGNVQGPFQSAEMAEWFNSGYFKDYLLVRRSCDEKYSPLSELKKLWDGVPFLLDYFKIPPIKNTDPAVPIRDEALLMQVQMQQQQQRLIIQRNQALAKLRQSEHFNNLPLEQQQMLVHQQTQLDLSLQASLLNPHNHTLSQPPPPQPQPHTNANVLAMMHQLAQYHQLPQALTTPQVPLPVPSAAEHPPDPMQQLLQKMSQQNLAPRPTLSHSEPDQRSIEQFMNAFRQRQATPHSMESVWGGATPAPSYPAWSGTPGHATGLPQSLWIDSTTNKGIKTEQELLEEHMRAEEKKMEDLRKQEELQRLKEEEEQRQRRLKEEEELERRRKEEEEKERERERKRLQEEEERKKKEAAAAKKAEQDRLRKEEEKKRKEEEKRRKEEEKKRLEEEKKRAEEEKKKLEEERKKKEETVKRQNEALKRLQEQQQQARAVKPTPVAPWTTPEAAGTSLADIQKTERKRQQQLREQQEMLRAYQEKHQQEQQELKNAKSMSFKWAESVVKNQPSVTKSLDEIQAEEHERMAKQAEREKAERMAAAKDVPTPAPGSIWASAPQSLNWSTASAGVWGTTPNAGSGSGSARFWDEVSTKAAKPQPPPSANKSQAKTKAKKEEASVLKIFDKQMPKNSKSEEFNRWCSKTLAACNSEVDIPTFVEFLLTFKSQKDVREYIQMCLGNTQEVKKFASEFIERHTRLYSADQPLVRQEPPPPNQSNHFQEVKGKNKKVKKGKMTKVDSRILGFNVTAAPDRINVGDRDYGEGL